MFYKLRTKPSEISILKSLYNRLQLPNPNQQTHFNLQKGYEGEIQFDNLMEALKCDCAVINDLLLKVNNQTFQIDSLLILNNQMYVFEIKNYEGDYIFKEDRFFQKNKPQNEISNPLIQLTRTESLLRQLLNKYNLSIPVNSFVIFINPKFTLFQSSSDKPFIFASQLERFMENLNLVQSKLNEKHRGLAEKLISLNIDENPYNRLPTYQYKDLRKGITCSVCCSFLVEVRNSKCVCMDCGHEEKVKAAVIRSVEEFKSLFPNEKITTNKMFEWCEIIAPKRKIQRILKANYVKVGVHQWMYYE